jgi:hypothetical protein
MQVRLLGLINVRKKGNSEAVQFHLGIHKSEPDIYIGFSPALHLQRVPILNNNSIFYDLL